MGFRTVLYRMTAAAPNCETLCVSTIPKMEKFKTIISKI
jgi:hypothetical protein